MIKNKEAHSHLAAENVHLQKTETSKEEILRKILEEPKPLTPEQKRAVLSDKPYVRVVAGAGTGKTETLTRRIVYLLLYKGEDPRSIAAFTFTERAARSMKSRIYERVARLNEDVYARLGEMYMGTIHGYCLRVLEDEFGYGNHDVLDENQEMAFLLREGWGLGLGKDGWYCDNCGRFLRSVNVVYDECIPREKLQRKDPDFLRHLERYEELLTDHRLLTFGRMIALAVEHLEQKPRALKGVKYLLVDEYQDINRAQEKLIKLIGRNANVFVVGDPRQSIYQWRGSDEKCFEDFPKAFPWCDKNPLPLKGNRRSGRSIVEVANTFAKTFERAKYEPLDPVREENGSVVLAKCDTDESEAEWVAEQIGRLIRGNVCKYPDIAVLLRSVKTSAKPFLRAFDKHDFPVVVGGNVGLFQRNEIQAVGRLFAWLASGGFWVENPYRWREKIEGDELLETAIDKWKAVWKKVWGFNLDSKRLLEKLESWRGRVTDFNDFTALYQELLTILGFLELDPSNKLQAAVMANLGRFSTLLTDFESSIRLGGREFDWQRALKNLCWYMNTYAIEAYEEQPVEDLRGIDAIQIMTVHQAKGLEWPIVFLPCAVDSRFPSKKSQEAERHGPTQDDWYVPIDTFPAKRYCGGIEDERRLFYVAVTRAMDALCLSYFKRMKKHVSQSRFLDKIEGKTKRILERDRLPPIEIGKHLDEAEMQTFSAGEIIAYLKCPFLYRLRETWGYEPGFAPALGYGKSLHHCLRHASELIKQGVDSETAIHKIVREKFHLPYAGGTYKEGLRKKGENTLIRYVKHYKRDLQQIEEVESRLEFPMEKATITGKVDVIIKEGDTKTLEVRDYKTSDEMTTFEQSCLQVRLYTLGLQTMGRPATRASVAYLKKYEIDDTKEGQVRDVPVGNEELQAAKAVAVEGIRGIDEGSFKAKSGAHCKKICDYSEICRYKQG